MAILRTTAVVVAVAALAGCDLERDPTPLEFTDEQVAVHALLVAGENTAAVLLTRVLPERAGNGFDAYSEPLSGATVRITSGADTLWLRSQGIDACTDPGPFEFDSPVDWGPGCYTAVVPGGIREGRSYELIADLPDGGTIRGSATVPAPPKFLEPEAGTVFKIGIDPESKRPAMRRLRWSSLAPDRRLELRLELTRPECTAWIEHEKGTMWGANWDMTGQDSVVMWVEHVVCDHQVEEGRFDGHLLLTAYDTAYSRYIEEALSKSVRLRDAAAGITGAIGVFAGAASAALPVVLQ